MSRSALRMTENFRRDMHSPDAIKRVIERYGKIDIPVAEALCELLEKEEMDFHIEIVVHQGCLFKTIDNLKDAMQTIKNINIKRGDV